MRIEIMDSDCKGTTTTTIGKGLLMAPKTAGYAGLPLNKHRRAGSTGTTGDESYTTDEEDSVEPDEPDCSIKEHVTNQLFNRNDHSDFGSFSDIATITDKVGHLSVMHRNSSDSSVYSDLGLDKCVHDLDIGYIGKDDECRGIEHDGRSSSAGGDHAEWEEDGKESATIMRLQDELNRVREELKLKDEEVDKLTRIRRDVEAELEELTASLFQVSASNFPSR